MGPRHRYVGEGAQGGSCVSCQRAHAELRSDYSNSWVGIFSTVVLRADKAQQHFFVAGEC